MNDRRDRPESRDAGSSGWLDRLDHRMRSHFARRPSKLERRRESVLRDWYGPERASCEIGALRSEPRQTSGLVDEVLKRIGFSESVTLEKVTQGWQEMVGKDISRRAQPLALRGRVLIVEVPSPTMRYILKGQQYANIRQALQDYTDGAVADVRFEPPGRLAARTDKNNL